MKRTDKILSKLVRSGYGMEIGPSYNPIAPKREGFTVDIIDHMSRQSLLEKYRGFGVPDDRLALIEDVDYIWQGEEYGTLTGKTHHYDWIIASHVVEHMPDLIAFFQQCDHVMKGTGILSLVVPDMRYCFDHFRPLSSLSSVIDKHMSNDERHSPGTAAEFYLNAVSRGDKILWSKKSTDEFKLAHSLDDALKAMKQAQRGGAYEDYHSWCFVPHSFRLMIQDLHDLGLIPFQELEFFPTAGYEFFISLSRAGNGIDMPRLNALDIIKSESAE
jgi:hypothetical protein